MSVFDGSDDDLTFAEALLAIAERTPWATEHQKTAAKRAIQQEFDMVPPEPEVPKHLQDSRDVTIRNQDTELVELRKRVELANARREAAEAERDAKDAELRNATETNAVKMPAAWSDPAGVDTETAKPAETSTGRKKA